MTTDYTHPQFDAQAPKWRKVRDAVAGEDAVKAAGALYLPQPNALDTSGNAAQRYTDYLRRAVYYNATGRTLAGLVGVAFANMPQIVTGKPILLRDVNGSGVDIIGQAQRVLSDVLQTGRGGLLADYSKGEPVNRPRNLAQAEAAGIRPLLGYYCAENILTWETEGGRLTRIVLRETAQLYEGGKVRELPQLRELLLDGGRYLANIWRKFTETGEFILTDTIEIGLPFIPFAFVGATNNDADVDLAPLLDLANLNLAHYRNSADYQESVFLTGQPTLWISGATEEWKDQIEKSGGLYFGARGALVLPDGGSCGLLQAAPNTLAKESMDNTERQMQAIGARLISKTEAVKTATQSAAETKAAYSVLSLACDNVSAAYTQALRWLDTWGTVRESKSSFTIDTRFNDLTLDANAIRETVAAWQAGLVPQSDAWAVLRQLGVIDQAKTDEQLRGEIDAQGPALALDAAPAGAVA